MDSMSVAKRRGYLQEGFPIVTSKFLICPPYEFKVVGQSIVEVEFGAINLSNMRLRLNSVLIVHDSLLNSSLPIVEVSPVIVILSEIRGLLDALTILIVAPAVDELTRFG